MWSASLPQPGERREEPRRSLQVLARLETTDARPVRPLEAVIEERSPRGVRLRSENPLMPDSALVLRPRGELRPLHARIVWARKESAGSRRLDAFWRAGCRLQGEEVADPAAGREGAGAGSVLKGLTVAGVLGLAALLVYAVLRFVVAVGEQAAR